MTCYYLKCAKLPRAHSGFRFRWMARAFLWVFCIGDNDTYQAYSIVSGERPEEQAHED